MVRNTLLSSPSILFHLSSTLSRSSAAENTRGKYTPFIIVSFFLTHLPFFSETCIKGHRSSSCKHTDRPLFEIKKKGRPVTQCEHCRELRKTKQVHVKCICESRTEPSSSSKQGVISLLLLPNITIGSWIRLYFLFVSLYLNLPPPPPSS